MLDINRALRVGSRINNSTPGNPLYSNRLGRIGEQLNTVVVNTMDDFPAPVAGVITLESKQYIITGDLSTSNRFNLPDGVALILQGYDSSLSSITYTGSGTAFTGQDILTFTANQILLSAPNGTLMDFNPSTSSAGGIFFDAMVVYDVSSFGTISNLEAFSTVNSAYVYIGTGLTWNGGMATINIHQTQFYGWKNQSTSFLNINGANDSITINSCAFFPQSNESIFDIDSSSTAVKGVVASNTYISEGGASFASGSKNQTDIYWKFTGNGGIRDSAATVELSLANNSTQTTFTAVDTPTLVLGTWTDSAERFSTSASGRATYTGLEEISLQVFANPTSLTGTGTNKDVSYYFVHGNETDHAITAYADAGGGQVTVTSANHGLSNGDRVAIRNSTNYNGTFTISNVATNTFEITDTWVSNDAAGDWALIIESSRAADELVSTLKAKNTAVLYRLIFDTNDYVELFIENNTDANPFVVRDANLTIG